MKAKNGLAVALITALTLIAALVWLDPGEIPVPPEPGSGPIPMSGVTSPGDPAAPDNEAASAPKPDQGYRPVLRPKRPFPRCQWGTVPMYDDASKVGERCLESPHHDYSDETLEVLAYSDAEAARVLAMRLRYADFNRALQLALRSIALSGGDTRILYSAENWQLPEGTHGKATLKDISHRYVVSSLRNLIDHGGYERYPAYENQVRGLAGDPEATLHELDRLVQQLYEDLQRLELELTGQSMIGGDDDV